MAVDAVVKKIHGRKIRQLKVRFASGLAGEGRSGPEQREYGDGSKLCEFTAQGPGICKPGKHSRSSIDHLFTRQSVPGTGASGTLFRLSAAGRGRSSNCSHSTRKKPPRRTDDLPLKWPGEAPRRRRARA